MIVQAPTPAAVETPISSHPFWPEIEPEQMRDDHRIDNTVTPARLKAALIEAIATVNGELRDWRQAREAEGSTRLDMVETEAIDGISLLVHRYQRAVGCLAKALLLERYRDVDPSARGDRKAEGMADPIDDLRRDHLNAIADLLGQARITVELI